VGPSLVLRLGAQLLVLVPASRRKHYKLDIIFYFILSERNRSKYSRSYNCRNHPARGGTRDVLACLLVDVLFLLLKLASIDQFCSVGGARKISIYQNRPDINI
jgi:hypothetical protein